MQTKESFLTLHSKRTPISNNQRHVQVHFCRSCLVYRGLASSLLWNKLFLRRLQNKTTNRIFAFLNNCSCRRLSTKHWRKPLRKQQQQQRNKNSNKNSNNNNSNNPNNINESNFNNSNGMGDNNSSNNEYFKNQNFSYSKNNLIYNWLTQTLFSV